MGKILAGILSPVSGKVAGVVGGRWKDKAYLRAYVKPANPNTAGQQAQRTKFSQVVAIAKPLVGQVFQTYTDKFLKAMSGFNFFIKKNIDVFIGTADWSTLKITEGPLSAVAAYQVSYAGTNVDIEWAVNYGNNGAADDKMFAAVLDTNTYIWYFPAAEVDRSTASINIVVPSGLSAADLESYVWPNRYVNTVLDIIGNSLWQDVT